MGAMLLPAPSSGGARDQRRTVESEEHEKKEPDGTPAAAQAASEANSTSQTLPLWAWIARHLTV